MGERHACRERRVRDPSGSEPEVRIEDKERADPGANPSGSACALAAEWSGRLEEKHGNAPAGKASVWESDPIIRHSGGQRRGSVETWLRRFRTLSGGQRGSGGEGVRAGNSGNPLFQVGIT